MRRIAVLLLLCLLPVCGAAAVFRGNSWPGARSIAHAAGEIEGLWYTNSLDALTENYERGWRVFETDLAMTSDGKLVLRHGWGEGLQDGIDGKHIPTLEGFLATPLYETYTPTSFADLCEWMIEYSDAVIVLDSKVSKPEKVRRVFRELVREAKAAHALDVLDRFVVYLYTEDMMDIVRTYYPFGSFIYATYLNGIQDGDDFTRIARYCAKHRIPAAMWAKDHTEENRSVADSFGIEIYVHTVNDAGIVMDCAANGAVGIITDTIDPEQTNELYRQAHERNDK